MNVRVSDNRHELVNELVRRLTQEPQSWCWSHESNRYRIRHPSRVELWVSYDIRVYEPREVRFGFWDRRRLRRAFRQWRRLTGDLQAAQLDQSNATHILMLLRSPPASARAA